MWEEIVRSCSNRMSWRRICGRRAIFSPGWIVLRFSNNTFRGHELEQFSSIPSFEVDKENCDVIFEGPTILQKQDASVNLFHHFCDFVNLYVSQHINGSFSRDVQIIWWDTVSISSIEWIYLPGRIWIRGCSFRWHMEIIQSEETIGIAVSGRE